MNKIRTEPFKNALGSCPPELKALIDSCPENMTDEEFLQEFLRWRSVARRIDADREVRK